MRTIAAACLLMLSTSALAAPAKLPPQWEATTREIYKTAVEMPTVSGRNQLPGLATYLAGKLKAAGWAEADLHVLPYTSVPGNETAALMKGQPKRREDIPIMFLQKISA